MDIAVLFADVRGSTGLGERTSPSAFAAHMNHFYRVATDILIAHDAVIDKLVGDEVMALFIPGYSGPEYRRRAPQAAEALMRAVGFGSEAQPWLSLGIGVHAGRAFVGNVGSSGVTDFTALGDTVNTTARLQAEAGAGEIVLSETIYEAVERRYPGLEARTITPRGREDALTIRVLRLNATDR